MELDQLHPSGGYYNPSPPTAQKINRTQELEKMAKSLPVIEDVLKDFDLLYEASTKLSALNPESKVPIESQVIALKELAKFAKREKSKFKTKYKNYIEATK